MKADTLQKKVLFFGGMVTMATSATVLAWNYALLGMFKTLPELSFGNVFVIYITMYLVKLLFTSPLIVEMSERLEVIDNNLKIIHNNETAQRKAMVDLLTSMESNSRTIHSNDVAQRKGMLEILAVINNKMDGEKIDMTHNEVV